ncbi:MAG TPA: universal stress protein [Pyrinomonadaceae bacterium]|nr:universal stress protein [Pyrinomonadaceae bacterium]
MVFPFRNILFPTDFSVNAMAALKYAAAFARHSHGRVVVFSVQDRKTGGDFQSQVDELTSDPLLKEVDTECFIGEGEPPREIAQAAINHDIDLITVVTRDRNRLSRAFGSSIAEDIVAEAPCTVLAVRPSQRDFVEQRDGQTEIQLKRMLLATNFRPSSVAATHLATQMANQLGAELHAVYVIGDYLEQISVMFPEGGLAALTRLRSYVQERMGHLARTGGAGTATHITEGRPYQEIVKLADTLPADLIVIGTAVHGSLFGSSQVLGSEIERVIRNAPCPVLCVPAARVVTPLPAFVTQIVPQT